MIAAPFWARSVNVTNVAARFWKLQYGGKSGSRLIKTAQLWNIWTSAIRRDPCAEVSGGGTGIVCLSFWWFLASLFRHVVSDPSLNGEELHELFRQRDGRTGGVILGCIPRFTESACHVRDRGRGSPTTTTVPGFLDL